MKKTKLLFAIGAGMLCGVGAMAQSTELFPSHEASMDLFGFYGSRDKGGNRDAWGMGAGFNYFITQNIGVGADTYMDAFTIPYLLNGQGIFRYPLKRLPMAPYVFAGAGRQWTHAAQWLGDIGVGLDYRFQPKMGAFVDVREVFPTETQDYTVLRFGFRFTFK
jgi:hypothetical protein